MTNMAATNAFLADGVSLRGSLLTQVRRSRVPSPSDPLQLLS